MKKWMDPTGSTFQTFLETLTVKNWSNLCSNILISRITG